MNAYVQRQLNTIIDKTQRLEMFIETDSDKAIEILKSFTEEEAEVLETVGNIYMKTAKIVRKAIEDFKKE